MRERSCLGKVSYNLYMIRFMNLKIVLYFKKFQRKDSKRIASSHNFLILNINYTDI